jgi:hypothetical protein
MEGLPVTPAQLRESSTVAITRSVITIPPSRA